MPELCGWYAEIGNHILNRLKRHTVFIFSTILWNVHFHRARMFPLFCPSVITTLPYFPHYGWISEKGESSKEPDESLTEKKN